MCACIILPDGEIFVVGGYTSMLEGPVRVDLVLKSAHKTESV